jgi:alcohol dehydrogenase class IV
MTWPATTFAYDQAQIRVVFGVNALDLIAGEVQRLAATRVLLVTTLGRRGLAEQVSGRLGTSAVGIFADAAAHGAADVVQAARAEAVRLRADGCVAVGGGSAIGLAKAVAATTGVPVVAIPTTYSGSEMTSSYGVTAAGVKTTRRDPAVRPKTVIYDPLLTLSLPPEVAGPSGMNAMAHLIEALYAQDANPLVTLTASEGLRVLARALPLVVATPSDIEARRDALYGAWLGGSVVSAVDMALHHKLCHVVGGVFNIPHAATHAALLPHSVAYNREAAGARLLPAAKALGSVDVAQGVYDLAVGLGIRMALSDLGVTSSGLARAARRVTEGSFYNPRPVEYAPVLALLTHAFEGRRPS